MTIRPSQGAIFGYDVETALGTSPASYGEIRYQDTVTFPSDTRIGIANPNMGHMHAYDKSDKPIFIEKYRESGVKFSSMIRRSASAATVCPIGEFFESAGCEVTMGSGTTLATYTSTTEWTLTADDTDVGEAGLVELNSGVYYPVLVADYVSGTKTVTPSMALPSAALATNAWEPMTTITPYSRQVPTNKTISFQWSSRGHHTASPPGDLCYDLLGCALAAVDDLTLKPAEAPILGMSFHLCKTDQKASAIAAESFVDSEKFAIITDDFCFEVATASSSGAIARADGMLKEATISFGFTTTVIPGEGSGTVASAQGYMHVAGIPKVVITADFSADYWTALEGTNTSQYLGLVQPTRSVATPAFGFWMPNCYLDAENPPVVNFTGDDYINATVTYIGTSAGYNSETLNAESGAAPWYFAISGSTS